jgi:hypothetical protein
MRADVDLRRRDFVKGGRKAMRCRVATLLWMVPVVLVLTGCLMSDVGRVEGVLVDSVSEEPVRTSVELWRVEVSADGQTATFHSPVERVTAESNASGAFEFKNVEPGHYLLFVEVGVPSSLVALEDEHGEAPVIEVEAGQVVDLGEVPAGR